MSFGILEGNWTVMLVYFLIGAHLSNAFTSLYLHRSLAHGAVRFSPVVSWPMRLWIWLSTGVNAKQWVACHRKHHSYVDKEEDPHSPVILGTASIVFLGWNHYRRAVKDRAMVEKYGRGLPDDWWERNVFSKPEIGPLILLLIDLVLFGWTYGAGLWVLQMIHMPLQGGIINGIGHAWGYRSFQTKDHSTNILPFGLWISGEELHNNHHSDPMAARFRKRWFEIDMGWIYIRALQMLGLASSVRVGRRYA